MISRRSVVAALPLAILLIAFAVRALDLSGQSLWYDEGFTVMVALKNGPFDIIARSTQLELNTPLHYLLLKAWMAGAGVGEFSARLLSVFAGAVTVALTLPLARLAIGRASVLPGLLVALSPVCAMSAREVRMYALASSLCVASTVLLLACLQRGSRGQWLAWAAISLAAFATHVLSAFVIGAQALVWLIDAVRERRTRPVVASTAVAAVCGVVVISAALFVLGGANYGTVYGGRLEPLGTMALSLSAQALPRTLPVEWIGTVALIAGSAFALAGAGLRRAALGLRLWCITAAALLGIALFGIATGKYTSRYPALLAPLVVSCIGMALAQWRVTSPRAGWLGAAVAVGLVVASTYGLHQLRSNAMYANEDFRAAAAHIRANAQADEAVVLVSGHFAPVFEYYYGQDGWVALPDDPVLDVNNTLDYASTVPASNVALAGKGGAWLLLWQDDVIDPTGIVPALLKRQSQNLAPQLDSTDFPGLRLQHYRFFHPYRSLPEMIESASSVEPVGASRGLSSLGCAQPHTARIGDGWIEVHCLWQVAPSESLSVYTKVSLRLFDRLGNLVLQSDQPISPKGMPFVPFEKPILGVYFIELPADLLAGEYVLRAIPYTEVEQIAPQVVTPITVVPKL
jgi:hypothetical protein